LISTGDVAKQDQLASTIMIWSAFAQLRTQRTGHMV
jgi:hypothetical protein